MALGWPAEGGRVWIVNMKTVQEKSMSDNQGNTKDAACISTRLQWSLPVVFVPNFTLQSIRGVGGVR